MIECVAHVWCCRQQERIAQDREDIEKQRKNLQKRKPPSGDAQEKKRMKKDTDGFVRPAEKSLVVSLPDSATACCLLQDIDRHRLLVAACR